MRYLVNLRNKRLTPDTDLFQASALDWLVESLEPRQMLAGLVTVAVSDAGDITITGDQQGNDIALDLGAGDLIINGIAGTSISLNGVVANQHQIDLGIDQALDRDLRIRMRGGEDVVDIFNLTVSRHLDVELGRGDDMFSMQTTVIEGQTNVKGGGGRFRDEIMFNVGTELDEDVFVATGPNRAGPADFVLFGGVSVFGTITVVGAAGSQAVRFDGSLVNAPINLKLGRGSDDVVIEASMIQHFSANLGSGDDTFLLTSQTVQLPFDCRLGGGNDLFEVENSTIAQSTFFHGGAGTDQALIGAGNTFTIPVSMASIEEINVA